MKTYKAIVIDDDLVSLKTLNFIIEKNFPELDIIALETDVFKAKKIITEKSPQIIFFDILFSTTNAFQILNEIEFNDFEIIFVSTYDCFGFEAFFYNATHYLLKPVEVPELLIAVNKAIANIEEKETFKKQLFQIDRKQTNRNLNYIVINSLDKIDVIKKQNIVFLKSEGRYTTFFLKNKTQVVACKNIGEYEHILDPFVFLRIHHSYIINSENLISITKKNGLYCHMVNEYELPVAKRRHEALNLLLKSNRLENLVYNKSIIVYFMI